MLTMKQAVWHSYKQQQELYSKGKTAIIIITIIVIIIIIII